MTVRHVLIHPGLHKTATSLLQDRVLSAVPHVVRRRTPALIDPDDPAGPDLLRALLRAFRLRDPRTFWDDPDGVELGRRMAALGDRLAEPGTGRLIISLEDLAIPDLFFRDARDRTALGPGEQHLIQHLRGLLRSTGWDRLEVGFLLGIRRQPDYLAALYAQWSHKGLASTRDFERGVRRLLARPEGAANDPIDLGRLVDGLRGLTRGRGSVTVLPLEAIGTPAYARAVADATWLPLERVRSAFADDADDGDGDGGRVNRRSVAGRRWALRPPRPDVRLGPLARRRAARPDRVLELRPAVEHRILARYAGSNVHLDATVPWDLRTLGYLPGTVNGSPDARSGVRPVRGAGGPPARAATGENR